MKVYKVEATFWWHGIALVAAESADEANKYIDEFDHGDYSMYHVSEDSCVDGCFAKEPGILLYEIYRDRDYDI